MHLGGQGVMEDLHCVVRGPSSGMRVIRDYSWEPETPKVQTKPFVIIFTEQLSVNLNEESRNIALRGRKKSFFYL